MIAEARSHVEHRGRSRQSAPADSCHRVHRTICWILRLYRGIIRRLSCLIGPCSGHRAHSIYHRATAISLCLSSRSAPVWYSMSCDKQAWISSSLNFRSPSQHSSSRSNTKSTQHSHRQLTHSQCCLLLANLSGSPAEKFGRWEKNPVPN